MNVIRELLRIRDVIYDANRRINTLLMGWPEDHDGQRLDNAATQLIIAAAWVDQVFKRKCAEAEECKCSEN